ncbi:MAG: bifunctional hydroxymethylpyrimidine kinase/phosphomethylpyrimidine kinase [Cyanobacteria bacterium J06639_1]
MSEAIASELTPPVALTIAGSDSGGGAGIQADLRAFSFHRVHGTSAITCITAQNTLGVTRVDALPPEAIVAQIDAVISDIGVQAVKTGMLLNRNIIEVVADALARGEFGRIVVDPVMVSRTGAQLLDDDAVAVIRDRLIPLADVLTPNRYEAELLTGNSIQSVADMQTAARAIHAEGAKAVLVKGGGLTGAEQGTDVWFDGDRLEILSVPPIATRHTHGTGCTLSAAIAARLALGSPAWEAVQLAKDYVTQAIAHALAIGRGQGPIGHFFPLLDSQLGS